MTTPPFLVRLMAHRALARTFKLGEEDREAYRFANEIRGLTLEGRLRAVFTHPANELGGQVRVSNGRRIVPPIVALAKALGLITGSSDYLFLWATGSAAIEFKSATGSLSPAQRDFRDWCVMHCVPFHVARNAAQALDILRGHGVLS